ncbi:MAG: acylneuraminate cytidylyltransferase family protein [bacterium]
MKSKEERSIIAVIPARRGSTRLPRKNVLPLRGKPLVAHAIDAALETKIFAGIYVSTDDPEVAKIADQRGVHVIERPEELCKDSVLVDKVMLHVMQVLESRGERYGAACLMTPTAPLRTVEDVKGAVELLWERNADFVITVTAYDHTPFHALEIKDGILQPVFMESPFSRDPKSLPTLYRPIAIARMGRWEAIMQHGTTFSPGMVPYVVPPEHAVDIDNAIDLKFAEFLLEDRIERGRES